MSPFTHFATLQHWFFPKGEKCLFSFFFDSFIIIICIIVIILFELFFIFLLFGDGFIQLTYVFIHYIQTKQKKIIYKKKTTTSEVGLNGLLPSNPFYVMRLDNCQHALSLSKYLRTSLHLDRYYSPVQLPIASWNFSSSQCSKLKKLTEIQLLNYKGPPNTVGFLWDEWSTS